MVELTRRRIMKVKLTNGEYTVISSDDKWLTQWNWYKSNKGYVYRKQYIGKVDGKYKYKSILLHKEIMKENGFVDHLNGNKLDNRRKNLRYCTSAQNAANRHSLPTNKSGYKGVSWYKPTKKWRAAIHRGKGFNLGYYQTKEEAALAYNVAAEAMFGKFAVLNEVD